MLQFLVMFYAPCWIPARCFGTSRTESSSVSSLSLWFSHVIRNFLFFLMKNAARRKWNAASLFLLHELFVRRYGFMDFSFSLFLLWRTDLEQLSNRTNGRRWVSFMMDGGLRRVLVLVMLWCAVDLYQLGLGAAWVEINDWCHFSNYSSNICQRGLMAVCGVFSRERAGVFSGVLQHPLVYFLSKEQLGSK